MAHTVAGWVVVCAPNRSVWVSVCEVWLTRWRVWWPGLVLLAGWGVGLWGLAHTVVVVTFLLW